jgi:hypothetical protein
VHHSSDDEPYANEVAREFASLGRTIYSSAFGDEPFLNDLPTDYGRASYFDRMWNNGKKIKRFFLRYYKNTTGEQ